MVLRHAALIEQYAIRIAEAHGLGYGPGEHTDIWGVEFQRNAQKVWKETLAPLFHRQVADSYERCAWLMGSVSPDQSVAGDWENVAGYLSAVAVAINKDPDCAELEVPSGSLDIRHMPEVIHYERLAELMHPDAAERLRSTAAAVAHYCRTSLSIVPDEMQLACLQGLANGEKHADLAMRLGYSERHLQRILADMWHQFGVDSTIEGVSHAVAQGWITVPNKRDSGTSGD
ncbi:hypothetical protein [Candidatus Poriferisocius sp.]|uniref:hypothetical protein n=1 Tax=Candidatus Poriferisocius sp. TaxID=3101276 RepID=UPI003B52CAE3